MEINDINFPKIKAENLTVTTMRLQLKKVKDEIPILLDLLYKFPNLSDFYFEVNNLGNIKTNKGMLEFIEKPE